MPHLAIFQRGCTAAAMLFAVIERKPRLGGDEDMAAAEFAARCSLAPAGCSPLAAGMPALGAGPPDHSGLSAITEEAAGEAVPDVTAAGTGCMSATEAAPPGVVCSSALALAPAGGFPLMPAGGCRGELELARVTFAYPARPQRNVLRGLSLAFPAGEGGGRGGITGGCAASQVELALLAEAAVKAMDRERRLCSTAGACIACAAGAPSEQAR